MPSSPSSNPEDKIRKEIMNEYLRNHTEQTSEEIAEMFLSEHSDISIERTSDKEPWRKLALNQTLNEFYEMVGSGHSQVMPYRSYMDIFDRLCKVYLQYERMMERKSHGAAALPFPMSNAEASKKALYEFKKILSHYKKDKDNFEQVYKLIPHEIRKVENKKELRSLLRRLLNKADLINTGVSHIKKPKVPAKQPFYEKKERDDDFNEEAA